MSRELWNFSEHGRERNESPNASFAEIEKEFNSKGRTSMLEEIARLREENRLFTQVALHSVHLEEMENARLRATVARYEQALRVVLAHVALVIEQKDKDGANEFWVRDRITTALEPPTTGVS